MRPLLLPRKTPVWDNGGRKSRICLLYKIFIKCIRAIKIFRVVTRHGRLANKVNLFMISFIYVFVRCLEVKIRCKQNNVTSRFTSSQQSADGDFSHFIVLAARWPPYPARPREYLKISILFQVFNMILWDDLDNLHEKRVIESVNYCLKNTKIIKLYMFYHLKKM